MGYNGQIFRIPLGSCGLMTDEVQTRVRMDALLNANNLDYRNGMIEKARGTLKWNRTSTGSPILALYDFWPNDVVQRVIAVCADGSIRRFRDRVFMEQCTPALSTDPSVLTLASDRPPCLVAGGAENALSPRKLFIFTGTSQVQVISDNIPTYTSIAKPANDWKNGPYPSSGLIHNNSLVTFLGHMMYLSNPSDHTDFQTLGATLFFPVFPGEGESILGGYVFKGRLFIFKYPFGVYYLDDTDPSTSNWRVRKLTTNFGSASAFAVAEGLNDAFVANSNGSITQMSATLNFGSMETGNLMRNLRNEGFMRSTTARFGYRQRYGVWYEDGKQLLFTYRSSGGTRNDRICVVDYNDPQTPRLTWFTKDQPNCLALMKDSLNVPRPFYGASDGYIYQLDWPTYDVNGSGYEARFQTIHHDFGSAGPGVAERMKIYDFLEVTFKTAGTWNLHVDVYIDDVFSNTYLVPMTKSGTPDYTPQSFRIPIYGTGRRISFSCYNSDVDAQFGVSELGVYWRPAGQAQKG